MAHRMETHHRRRSPAAHHNIVEGRAVSVGGESVFGGSVPKASSTHTGSSQGINTNGGVETFTGTATGTHIVIDTGIPTTQSPTLFTNPTPTQPPPSSSSPLLDPSLTSSTLVSPSSPVPSPSSASGSTSATSWAASHKLILAGIIAAFVALALAITFILVVAFRRARKRREAEDAARKSFAAGAMSERPDRPYSKASMLRFGNKRRTWDGLGSRDDIDASAFRFGGAAATAAGASEQKYPTPPREYARNEKLSRANSLAPSIPEPEPHEPFSLTNAFGASSAEDDDLHPPQPSISPQPLARLRTITPQTGKPEFYTRQDDPPSFLSISPSSAPQQPPSPPLPAYTSAKVTKAARSNNIRALDNLIAALDDGRDDAGSVRATRLPDPSVWRAALGGSNPPSSSHAAHDQFDNGFTR